MERRRHTKNFPRSCSHSAQRDDNISPPYTRNQSALVFQTITKPKGSKYLILLPPKPLQITPSTFIHSIRIPQISGSLIIQPRRNGVLFDSPTIPEAIRKFIYCEDELALCSAAFFEPGF
jgi:hypothetical protein